MCILTLMGVSQIRLRRCCRLRFRKLKEHSVSEAERELAHKLKTLRRNNERLNYNGRSLYPLSMRKFPRVGLRDTTSYRFGSKETLC